MSTFFAITSLTTAAPTAAFDALEITLASGIGRLWRLHIWQTSDLKDVEEEMLPVQILRGYTTSGSGGQTTVITPLNSSEGAAGFAAELLNTTVATAGSPVGLGNRGWNIRTDFDWLWPPEQCPILRTTERLVARVGAPTDAITVNCSAVFEQL